MNPPDARFPPRPTALAQDLLRPWIGEGDTVIDATAGNGHDTVFLAGLVGESGKVLAFDIQEAALASARERVNAAGFAGRVAFLNESHANMANHARGASVKAVMFNLGYLPGDNHELTTQADETLTALKITAELLVPGGILSVVCYPGHDVGAGEASAVETWMTSLATEDFRIAKYDTLGTRKPAPFLLLAKKSISGHQAGKGPSRCSGGL